MRNAVVQCKYFGIHTCYAVDVSAWTNNRCTHVNIHRPDTIISLAASTYHLSSYQFVSPLQEVSFEFEEGHDGGGEA